MPFLSEFKRIFANKIHSMPVPDISPIENQIKTRKLAPVYLLWGEEDYFIDRLTDEGYLHSPYGEWSCPVPL